MTFHDELTAAAFAHIREDIKKKAPTDEQIAALTDADILSVYSGRPGCACGCRGIHRYNPAYPSEGSKERGYKVEPDEMNIGHVRKVLKIIKDNASSVKRGGNNLSIETGGKLYIIYPIAAAGSYDDARAGLQSK
jgi:hypothetical protein